MVEHYKVLIIGSGVAGVHAALPLVEAGISVAMIDGGNSAPSILEEPVDDFVTMRKNRNDQWRWFLGEDYSNISLTGLHGAYGGGMVGGNKEYVVKDAASELPITSNTNTVIVQSIAMGGLAAAWGGACVEYNEDTLQSLGLPVSSIIQEYTELRSIIGISGTESFMQPPALLDDNAEVLLQKSRKHTAWFEKHGMKLVQPSTALLTDAINGRQATAYTDMDYYSDNGRSIYRPQWTLEHLQTFSNFSYITPYIVTKIIPSSDGVTIVAINRESRIETRYSADYVILAAGAVGSARLVLQSFANNEDYLPLHAKTHVFIAGIQCNAYVQKTNNKRTSLCQLVIVDTQKKIASFCAQIYSYRSLLVFRLLSSVPLALRQSFYLLSALLPRIILVDVRFTHEAPCSKIRYANGVLSVSTRVSNEITLERKQSLRRCSATLRKCGVFPVKTFTQAEGTASHYAGTLPINDTTQKFFTTNTYCLNIDERIFVADSSAFRTLPALPQTLTIMAYARSVAKHLVCKLL